MAYQNLRILKHFGKKVRTIRTERKMSQTTLAIKTGFALSQIGRIERGTVNTSISHAAAIAKALEYSARRAIHLSSI
ncbi:XRE family transcriptional regulator [Segetibacter sp. 3557_3]|uniref:helix-turn-helix domain-containing protein n=1 Tax=Segetibacter sp. 3557_3 TaxID=2547429 RepID=UPI001058D61A|nr:XRE family transcriptional regulator [Segetibacter sp. 3557_3]